MKIIPNPAQNYSEPLECCSTSLRCCAATTTPRAAGAAVPSGSGVLLHVVHHPLPHFEPLERPKGPYPLRRFFSLRLAMASAERCRSPDARCDTGILSAMDIGQCTSCDVGLAPTCSRNEAQKASRSESVIFFVRSPHEEPLTWSVFIRRSCTATKLHSLT